MTRINATVYRHPISGAWIVSTMLDTSYGSRLIVRQYYGGRKRDALRDFRAEMRAEVTT